ncbi:MAG: DNA-directed RNA polymerase subunit alpha C-terminal domain-containing protein [Planctomycetota bacterium]
METQDLPAFRDLFLSTEVDAHYYTKMRQEFYQRSVTAAEMQELAGSLQGDPVREATAADLQGDRNKATKTLAAAATNPWAAYWHGYLLLEEGRTAAARKALEAARQAHGTHAEIGALLVEAQAQTGDTEAANELLNQLGIGADSSGGSYLRGVILERDGEYADALAAYENAVAGEPTNPRFNFRLGYLSALHGDESRAVSAYEACLHNKPVFVRAAINLGILYEDRDLYEKALYCYDIVLAAYPDDQRARMYYADAEASMDMYYDREKEKEKSRRKQLLQIPVTDFELSVRSRNCLAKMNIHTLGDLIQKTEAELLSYKNFGETSLAEIKKILAQKGFRLGQGLEDKPRSAVVSDPETSSLLGEPVSVLELSSRAQRCMDRLGIESLEDLVKRTELELVNQRNFGTTSLNEVKRKLKDRGLSLASG